MMPGSTPDITEMAGEGPTGPLGLVKQYREYCRDAGRSWGWIFLLILLVARRLAAPPTRRDISSDLYVMF